LLLLRIYFSSEFRMRQTTKPLYVRVDVETHDALARYARRYGYTVNDVVHMLCAVMLVQVDPDYAIPEFLKEAVATGFLRPARAGELRLACS
jgi:hypothetical protein